MQTTQAFQPAATRYAMQLTTCNWTPIPHLAAHESITQPEAQRRRAVQRRRELRAIAAGHGLGARPGDDCAHVLVRLSLCSGEREDKGRAGHAEEVDKGGGGLDAALDGRAQASH